MSALRVDEIVNSEPMLSKVLGDLRQAWAANKWLRVRYTNSQPRSLDYNAQVHVWFQQIADELREDTVLSVKAECKLHFGVPILRAEDQDFRAFYDRALKHSFTHKEKLDLMKFVPVTSLMTQDQMKQFATAMQEHYAKRGVVLSYQSKDRADERRD